MKLKSLLIDKNTFGRTLTRISHEIIEKNDDLSDICIIGIKTRGVPLAERIAENIRRFENAEIKTGTLDITHYRDDLTHQDENSPVVASSQLPFDVSRKNVILVDDVLFTGRTVRAALDAIISHGRPSKIQLAVLIDRGHRELPIRPDYVGKNIPTSKSEIIKVSLSEIDGEDKSDRSHVVL